MRFYMYKGADLVIKDNVLINGHLAFKEMVNLTLEIQGYRGCCWPYRFLQVSGSASGNTLDDEPFDTPLSTVSWKGCWL